MEARIGTCTEGWASVTDPILGERVIRGTAGGIENPSSTDSPTVSRESAGLRRVGGTPSICMRTARQRNRITATRTPVDRVRAILWSGPLNMTQADYSLSARLASATVS